MKKLSKIFFAFILSAVVLSFYTTQAHADVNQNESFNENVNVTCDTGAYGQNTNCTATATQSGSQNQSVTGTPANEVVTSRNALFFNVGQTNTSADPATLAAGAITMISSAAGAVITLKKRI